MLPVADSLHLYVLYRGEDDSNGLKEQTQEPVPYFHITVSLILTNTSHVETQVDLMWNTENSKNNNMQVKDRNNIYIIYI